MSCANIEIRFYFLLSVVVLCFCGRILAKLKSEF